MKFGFQISIAGGFSKVVNRAKITGCETIQLFSRNPRSWKAKLLDTDEVKKFKQGVNTLQISPVFVHMPYLPNLASSENDLWMKSVDSLCLDLKRAEQLNALAIIIHAGYRMRTSLEKAIDRIAQGINLAFSRVKNPAILLIENTAGEGSAIGYNFSQIKAIFEKVAKMMNYNFFLLT